MKILHMNKWWSKKFLNINQYINMEGMINILFTHNLKRISADTSKNQILFSRVFHPKANSMINSQYSSVDEYISPGKSETEKSCRLKTFTMNYKRKNSPQIGFQFPYRTPVFNLCVKLISANWMSNSWGCFLDDKLTTSEYYFTSSGSYPSKQKDELHSVWRTMVAGLSEFLNLKGAYNCTVFYE